MEQEAERETNFIDDGNKAFAYQNKDITSKVLAENLKGKTFRAYEVPAAAIHYSCNKIFDSKKNLENYR